MPVKDAVQAQLWRIVDAAIPFLRVARPPQGWVRTVRSALGMSGQQLGRRLGVTRARISAVENSEVDGAVTLRTMTEVAEALGCRFVYAIVPNRPLADVIKDRARSKATRIVGRSSMHMALEDQSLTPDQREEEIERVARELFNNRPPDFWEDHE